MLQESKLQNILAPFLSNGKFGKYLPFSESSGTKIFSLKNTEFLNVSWALILLNLLTRKSLNSNKLLLVLYFTNYYNGETFMTKIFGTKFLSFKFDIENEIFHLFEEKEGIHTDKLV